MPDFFPFFPGMPDLFLFFPGMPDFLWLGYAYLSGLGGRIWHNQSSTMSCSTSPILAKNVPLPDRLTVSDSVKKEARESAAEMMGMSSAPPSDAAAEGRLAKRAAPDSGEGRPAKRPAGSSPEPSYDEQDDWKAKELQLALHTLPGYDALTPKQQEFMVVFAISLLLTLEAPDDRYGETLEMAEELMSGCKENGISDATLELVKARVAHVYHSGDGTTADTARDRTAGPSMDGLIKAVEAAAADRNVCVYHDRDGRVIIVNDRVYPNMFDCATPEKEEAKYCAMEAAWKAVAAAAEAAGIPVRKADAGTWAAASSIVIPMAFASEAVKRACTNYSSL